LCQLKFKVCRVKYIEQKTRNLTDYSFLTVLHFSRQKRDVTIIRLLK